MSGIIFLATKDMGAIREFYLDKIGMELWLEQEDCAIFRHGNLLLGFCRRDRIDDHGIITFFYESVEQVDEVFDVMWEEAVARPLENEKYCIYHFFAKDPEGRMVEFQSFLQGLGPYMTADDVLRERRSVRTFQEKEVPDDILWQVFELCRSSPISKMTRSYYFIVIRNRNTLRKLAASRGSSSSPIARAPVAVAICSDPGRSGAHIEESCVASYHFIIGAWAHGLGTCWIAGMDRDDVKDTLGIPKDHYVATVTPVGYPLDLEKGSMEKETDELVRYI